MLRDSIEKFVEHYLMPSAIEADKCKFVHDPLWGTIEVMPYELDILDSPLLQRLRQIHQTGFVHATFPSARHSRFEHTLGVMHIAGKMAKTLRVRYPNIVDGTTEQRVRLAALLHDSGHSAFSHTSEEVYSQCGDIVDLLSQGGEFEGKGAGEVISYLIVTSRTFRKFYQRIKQKHPDLQIEVDDFAPLILSRAARQDKQFEADIISGPFDADKLDYFPRDGRAAGIELALDIDRLHHCLELVEQQRTIGPNAGTNTNILIANRGGFTAIQQLLFARATLFSSVYHHHKVRACDCMVKGCFEYFRQNQILFKANRAFGGVSLESAAEYLFLTDVDFFAEANSHDIGSQQHKLIHNLLYRRLLKRVLTISTNTVESFEDETRVAKQKAGYDYFFNQRKNPRLMRKLAQDVLTRAKVNCSICEVWFDIPSSPTFKKAGDAQINQAPRGKPPMLKSLSAFIPVEKWVETYHQYYAQSFLFGPSNMNTRVKLACAARIILRESPYRLILSDLAIAEDIRESVKAIEGAANL
jgi:HD superfamily phosphohydrolase